MPTVNRYGGAYYFDGVNWRYTHNDRVVPNSTYLVDERTGNVELNAPELLVHQMLDSRDLAVMLGIEHMSVSRMLTRGDFCEPQMRVGSRQTPLWSRPVFEHWRLTRPGKGANFRKDADERP